MINAPIALNPDLDPVALADQFKANGGFIQIPDILQSQSAQLVYETLLRNTPWGLAWYDGKPQFKRQEDVKRLQQQDFVRMNQQLMARAQLNYAYLYHCYPLLTAWQEQWQPDHLLMRFLEFMNMDGILKLVRQVTGVESVTKADGQATFYAPNHFLLQHSDQFDTEYWRIAYVFNFSKNWREDWGGYLQFYDDKGDVTRALKPRFNMLNLFAVPRLHSVGQVAPFAGAPRFAITGWFRDQ